MWKWLGAILAAIVAVGLQAMSGKPDEKKELPFEQIPISEVKSSGERGSPPTVIGVPKKEPGFQQIDASQIGKEPGFDQIAAPRSAQARRDSKPDNYLDTIPVFWRSLYPNGGKGLYCGEVFKPRDRRSDMARAYVPAGTPGEGKTVR